VQTPEKHGARASQGGAGLRQCMSTSITIVTRLAADVEGAAAAAATAANVDAEVHVQPVPCGGGEVVRLRCGCNLGPQVDRCDRSSLRRHL